MVKTLKNLLLQNQYTNDLETLYVALSMQVLPRLFKVLPRVDLDTFYAKVKGHSDIKVKCLFFGLYTQVSDSGPLGPLVYISDKQNDMKIINMWFKGQPPVEITQVSRR